jgi:hypothetical protein
MITIRSTTAATTRGPEPEGVVIGKVLGKPYAFIGLERIGGVAVFDVSDPAAPIFVQYVNNRNFAAEPETDDEQGILPQVTSVPRDYSLLAMMRVQTAGRYWWWATRSARLPSTKSRARGAEEIDKRSRSPHANSLPTSLSNDQQSWPIYRESSDQFVDDIFKEFLAPASMLHRIRVAERVFFK